MTSTIKVNTITTESGSTLTVGGCGKTVALASGASQTGFGRTGTVNWVTTKKTTSFTAVSGEGYFCDTAASGAFTLTLPSSPSAGDIVGLKDYNGNFATANLTIGRGGSPINGVNAADVVIKTDGASIFLVYVDATQGWVATQDDSSTFKGSTFMVATGGNTVTTCGDDKIHTFTGPGTFTVCSVASCAPNNVVSYLVVAGGGGTSGIGANNSSQGGGGAGGFRELKSPATTYTASPLDGYPTPGNRITVTATGFPITVGAGGAGGSSGLSNPGANGSVSTFSTISSAGGGRGGNYGPSWNPAASGGSGGGGNFCRAGAAGNTPPVTPPQGNNGGDGLSTPGKCGGAGGGGAGAVGNSPAGSCNGAAGGIGAGTGINTAAGTPGPNGCLSYFAGGGAGGPYGANPPISSVAGGGAGAGPNQPGTAGTANTGGGASSGGTDSSHGAVGGAAGGSGIVIIRYKFQ